MSAHGQMSGLSYSVPPRSRSCQGFFGRLFSDLKPWEPPFPAGASGISDEAADAFFKEIASGHMKDTGGLSGDSKIPAGYTYFGQFIDHDITFDPTSSLMRQNDPERLHNFRTPRLDLDSVYGCGLAASPHFYEKDSGRFLIGKKVGKGEPDLPRNHVGTALVGDPRNDENLIVGQLQLVFLKFHNRVFDELRADGLGAVEAFSEARRLLTWTYQYVVWNDFVRRIVADDLWRDLLKLEKRQGTVRWKLGSRFYRWKNTPFMPVEFSVAAYRFGHSLVRDGYQINAGLDPGEEIPVFDLDGQVGDLRGGRPLRPGYSLQWDWFVDLPSSRGPFPQQGKKIDPFLSAALARIPAGPGNDNALAFLNLKRGWRTGLPSGPDVARFLGVGPVKTEPHEEALWFYILKEASMLPGVNGGNMLGRVGGTVVGEVFAGLLSGDPHSFFNLRPRWIPSDEPVLQNKGPWNGESWQLGDLVRIAQMPEDETQVRSLIRTGNFTPSV